MTVNVSITTVDNASLVEVLAPQVVSADGSLAVEINPLVVEYTVIEVIDKDGAAAGTGNIDGGGAADDFLSIIDGGDEDDIYPDSIDGGNENGI